ncbi:MAG TPA: GGDEF domain-containing protein [Chitinivibrionales bacterium]|nr:GGDEF domain-containing protein [Chitinivibrionales bacterium]
MPLQLSIAEIVLHSTVASILLGWTSYFGLYLMASVVIVFNSYSLKLAMKILEVIFISACFISLFIATGKGFLVIPVASPVLGGIGIFNVVTVVFSLAFLSLFTVKENDRLKKKLEEISELDELTGTYNRRFFNKYLDIEIKRNASHIKYRSPQDVNFGLAMLDLDDFKQINDTYGHLEGDTVLSEVAKIIKSALFERDILCRYGGEEFVILFTATPREGAIFAVDKIRKLIADHQVYLDKASSVHITVSIGFASFNEASDIYKLLALADQRLYKAKSEGKNRVVIS